jgi:signal transduction histidine kinase
MSARIGILCCHNFHGEVCAAVKAEGWTDVTPIEFPARCGRPPLGWEELRSLLPADCGHLIIMGRACLGGLAEPPPDFPPVKLLRQQQCFHLVASPMQVDQAITEGGYLLTPGWLADWRGKLREMGFEPETAGEFFKDFANTLVLFDTGIEPDSTGQFAELAKAVGLPAMRFVVGLDRISLLLAKTLLELRLEDENRLRLETDKAHRRELADQVSAMDLLERLAGTQNESDAQAAIEDVFRMLFAPATLHFVRTEDGHPDATTELPKELSTAIADLNGAWAWTPSGQGFLLRIAREAQTLALIVVDGLAFPGFRERYLNLALAMSGVCALAIDNARTHKRLVEAEKMASLGVLVAGVAHEINTPLGVGLAAASTLQKQSAEIALRFTERKMTQSNLQSYLEDANTESALIRSNLDRIGKLVDAFRQIAITGGRNARQRVNLRRIAEDVLASRGDQLAQHAVAAELICDPAIEVQSNPDDWVTIFSNLVGNSLQHGFRDRERGRIRIEIQTTDSQLRIDYSDDGTGMSPDVQRHVFDPFFSTDLQHGMGLGMHLVYNLVTQGIHGTIRCVSEPGQGCHFYIEVPR